MADRPDEGVPRDSALLVSPFFRKRLSLPVSPFCRKELSPQGEPARRAINIATRFRQIACTHVAASREVPLGKRDLIELLSDAMKLHERQPAKSVTAANSTHRV